MTFWTDLDVNCNWLVGGGLLLRGGNSCFKRTSKKTAASLFLSRLEEPFMKGVIDSIELSKSFLFKRRNWSRICFYMLNHNAVADSALVSIFSLQTSWLVTAGRAACFSEDAQAKHRTSPSVARIKARKEELNVRLLTATGELRRVTSCLLTSKFLLST